MTSIPLSRWRRYTFKTAIFSLRQRVKERKWKKFSSSSSRLSLERKSLLSFFFFFKFSFNRWYPIPFRGEFFHAHVATPRDSCRDGTRRENWIQSIWRGFIREIDLWWCSMENLSVLIVSSFQIKFHVIRYVETWSEKMISYDKLLIK